MILGSVQAETTRGCCSCCMPVWGRERWRIFHAWQNKGRTPAHLPILPKAVTGLLSGWRVEFTLLRRWQRKCVTSQCGTFACENEALRIPVGFYYQSTKNMYLPSSEATVLHSWCTQPLMMSKSNPMKAHLKGDRFTRIKIHPLAHCKAVQPLKV